MVSAAMKESAGVGFAVIGTVKITEAEQRSIDKMIREAERRRGIHS